MPFPRRPEAITGAPDASASPADFDACGPSQYGADYGVEICDGKDNDCDGDVDENLTTPCQTDCGMGTRTCTNGSLSAARRPNSSGVSV